jgi:photosystem II stability/assembly factor-like uncharacterized protein
MNRYRLAVLRLALLIAVASSFASAQDIPTDSLKGLEWRLIGSFRGGRVSAVAGVPDKPNDYYFGTPGGGIWKTIDAGHVWQPIFDKERVASIGSIAVAPSNTRIVYAGTGEQTPGKGVYRSEDEGQSWTHAGLEGAHFLQAIIVDPKDPNTLVAGANSLGMYVISHPLARTAFTTPRGVFKSTNGGKTWTQTLNNPESAGVFDLTSDPSHPNILYAALYIPASGPTATNPKAPTIRANSLLYQSADEGSSWQLMEAKGLPEKDRGRLGIAVASGTDGKRLYAIVDQGLFRSDDQGLTWTQSTRDPRILGSEYFSRVFADTRNPDILYLAQTSLYRSTDGGHTFEACVGAPSGDDFHLLWIDPNNPSRLLLGVDQGAIISVDAGQTWSSWFNQPTGQFYHITTDHEFPYRTYAAQQDSGTQSVPSRSDNGEITPQDVISVGGFEYCFIAPDPLHPEWIYSGGWYGSVVRYDRKTGQTATVFEKGDKYRVTQMPPLFFSRHDPKALYLGTQVVLKTTDEGKTWVAISPDLTEWKKPDPSTSNPEAARAPALVALSESPIVPGEMWAATSNRLVQLTRDGGVHWQKVTPPGITAPSQILYIEPSHYDPGTAYLTVGSGRESIPPQIMRTHDFGSTWQPIVQGLPLDEGSSIIREDPIRKGLLYAGTNSTVYVSFDDGDHWHPLTLNLPATPITDMEIHGDDLVLSTYGRGLWILDNLSPIRQLTPEILVSEAHLFHPSTALRVRWDTYQDTPLPIETPTARNPPDGVALDYFLGSAAVSPVITIKDAAGQIVRQYTGKAVEPYLPLPNVPEYWFEHPQDVDGAPGLHRFIWDLRYDSPTILPASYYGPILQYTEYTLADHAIPYETPRQQPQGPLVVPGKYTVEFTANGHTHSEPLTVTLDPRVHVTQQDLEAQLALAHHLLSGIALSYSEYQKANALQTAIEDRKKSLTAAPLPEDFEKQVQTLLNGDKDVPGLGAINRDLSRLLYGIEAADQRPTEPQVQAVDQNCSALIKVISAWQALNEKLRKENPLNLPIASPAATTGCTP